MGPAEGRGHGVGPDVAGSEVGSGVTALLSVPTCPCSWGRGALCLHLLQSTLLATPHPQAWLLPALPSFPVRIIFAVVLGALARRVWCPQHTTLTLGTPC